MMTLVTMLINPQPVMQSLCKFKDPIAGVILLGTVWDPTIVVIARASIDRVAHVQVSTTRHQCRHGLPDISKSEPLQSSLQMEPSVPGPPKW